MIDKLGSPDTHNHYPSGWAQAGNTPNKYYKKFTHAGGIRAPMIMHWRRHIQHPGIRTQFRHVTDIVPTLLDVVGISAPTNVNGVDQMPIHGQSMAGGFGPDPGTERTGPQYFEMLGNRAIVADGWKAVTRHIEGTPYETDRWELYRLAEDFSEVTDLAEEHPDVLDRLRDLWWAEAERFGVFPLDDRLQGRANARPSYGESEQRRFRLLAGTSPITSQAAPDFYDRSFSVTARVKRSQVDEGGVVICQGHHANGWTLFVQDSVLVLDYNLAGRHTVLGSRRPVPTGASTLALRLNRVGPARATASLLIDDEPVAEAELDTIPNYFGPHSVWCGRSGPSPVSDDYVAPFTFAGELHDVIVDLGDDKGQPADPFSAALTLD